jgi:hypothetical protein
MDSIKRIDLRLPSDLHQQIEGIARREARSVNSQIVYMLRQTVEAIEQEQIEELGKAAA